MAMVATLPASKHWSATALTAAKRRVGQPLRG
jgi:hypothetical protein